MKKVITVLANVLVPGTGQVVLGEPGRGALLAVAYGVAFSTLVVARTVVPGLLGRGTESVLVVVGLGAWCASQVLLLKKWRGVPAKHHPGGAAALTRVARLWLRGERSEALELIEALLDRWPTEPALHFVAARLWAEGPDAQSARRARLHLVLCRGCDVGGRWDGAVRRQLAQLSATSTGSRR